MRRLLATLILITAFAGSAHALPSLQLGPGTGDWSYDNGSQTWVTNTNPFSLFAYANDTTANGGSGGYAWDPAGAGTQTAYLVVSAVPMINFDGFDVTVENDGGALALVASGFGTPPVSDPNDLAPHGIFDTWFEIYCFEFDGTAGLISDTQPGETGTGQGFSEEIDITINSLSGGVAGIHMDLFTMEGDGILANNQNVKRFAPFSHDAENIPEPGTLLLLSVGIAGAGIVRRRRKK